MNLKKTLLSVVGAAAIVGSILAPVAADDTLTDTSTSNATIQEAGNFTFNFHPGAISFNAAQVSSTTGMSVIQDGPNHRVLFVHDERTSSPGYQLQMTASDLKHENEVFVISNQYLFVSKAGGGPHSSCMWSGAPEPVGNNHFQDHVFNLGDNSFSQLSSGVPLITAGAGRGCDYIAGNPAGGFQSNYKWRLDVPAGIATGVYTGSITITDMTVPVDPQT